MNAELPKSFEQKRFIVFLLFLGILPFELNGFYNPVLVNYPPLYWLVEILTWIILPSAIYVFGVRRKLFTPQEIGFRLSVAGKNNIFLFIAALIVVSIFLRWVYLSTVSVGHSLFPINYGAIPFNYKNVEPESGVPHLLAALHFSITAGIVEEMLYRGIFRLLFRNLKWGTVLYILASSLIFASVHWEGGIRNLFLAFCFGIVASSLFTFLKNLWPLIIGHILNDFLWLI